MCKKWEVTVYDISEDNGRFLVTVLGTVLLIREFYKDLFHLS
jgi:hypothetical protein